MSSINLIRRSNVLKILRILKSNYGIDRINFAELAEMNYNLLNQYLSDNAKKNIGAKTANKIMKPLGAEGYWLDQIRNEYEIDIVLKNNFNATSCVAQVENINKNIELSTYQTTPTTFRILPIYNIIALFRGQDLNITTTDTTNHTIEVSESLVKPIVFEIKSSGYAKPYRNGYVLICDEAISPEGGDDVIIITVDGKVNVGEFLYNKDDHVEIESINNLREVINKQDIEKIYTIVSFSTPRQIKKIK